MCIGWSEEVAAPDNGGVAELLPYRIHRLVVLDIGRSRIEHVALDDPVLDEVVGADANQAKGADAGLAR